MHVGTIRVSATRPVLTSTFQLFATERCTIANLPSDLYPFRPSTGSSNGFIPAIRLGNLSQHMRTAEPSRWRSPNPPRFNRAQRPLSHEERRVSDTWTKHRAEMKRFGGLSSKTALPVCDPRDRTLHHGECAVTLERPFYFEGE